MNYPVNGMKNGSADGGLRFPEGYDKDLITDWVHNNFNLADTPDHTNSPGPVKALNISEMMNETFVPPRETCGDPFTAFFTIQDSGLASLLDGNEVSTEGILISDFQDGKDCFYIQDAFGDGDSANSDGIFVYSTHLDVKVGDQVRVRGTVDEFYDLTEITSVSQIWQCGTVSASEDLLTRLLLISLG